MSRQRIAHDAAVAFAAELTGDLRGLVREEEARELFEILYQAIRNAVEAAFIFSDRESRRLRPSVN